MSKLVIFTGAGISAESGISTFRGTNGLWEGHNINEVCNYLTWRENYAEVHEFYNKRRMALSNAQPNSAHHMVKSWQDRYDTTIITQNIDDLFERAGCKNVMHVHGFATAMRCIACGNEWDIGYTEWNAGVDECSESFCHCKNAIKPDVIFFNEIAPKYRNMNNTLRDLTADDIVVVIGTSSNVVNIAGMLESKTCYKILNNLSESESLVLQDTEERSFDLKLFKPASEAIVQIDTELNHRLG